MNRPSKPRAVQVFPDDFQMLHDPAMPKQRSLVATKWLWRARSGWRMWWKGLFAPFTSAAALFQLLAVGVSLVFLSAIFGEGIFVERLIKSVESAWPVILALPVWAILNALWVPFGVLKAEKKIGAWDGPRFIYLEPSLLSISEIHEGGNVVQALMSCDDIPPGAVVDYRIDIEGPALRINCIPFGANFFRPADVILRSTRFAPRGRVVVRKDGTLRLLCYMQPETTPAQIRVYALGWEIDPTVCFDYTDESKGVRFVLSPPKPETA